MLNWLMKPKGQSEDWQGVSISDHILKAPMSMPPANSCETEFYPEEIAQLSFLL